MMSKPANTKLKKSGKKIRNFGIPAARSQSGLLTCPSAKSCAASCLAMSGNYQYKNVKHSQELNLALTQSPRFADLFCQELDAIPEKGRPDYIRVHDSGDFYDQEYLLKWIEIARRNPSITFYGYTKEVRLFKSVFSYTNMPDNFRFVYSFGGKDDALINVDEDRFSRVFLKSEYLPSDYIDASDDDLLSLTGQKIGLVLRRGTKNNPDFVSQGKEA